MRASLILLTLIIIGQPVNSAENIQNIKWLIDSIRGVGVESSAQTSLQILPEGNVATTIGCNRMMGSIRIEGDRIMFGLIAGTRMACAPDLMDREQLYAKALGTRKRSG